MPKNWTTQCDIKLAYAQKQGHVQCQYLLDLNGIAHHMLKCTSKNNRSHHEPILFQFDILAIEK